MLPSSNKVQKLRHYEMMYYVKNVSHLTGLTADNASLGVTDFS